MLIIYKNSYVSLFYRGAAEWNQISNTVKPGGNFVVLGRYLPTKRTFLHRISY